MSLGGGTDATRLLAGPRGRALCAAIAGLDGHRLDGPGAWCALTEQFPREVTLSRRHDWLRWTGFEGRWFLPDWAKVADAFDAVHLTVAGHLEASYRALLVSSGATCLAGFDPDETIWLTDVVTAGRIVEAWEGDIGRNRFQDRARPWLDQGPSREGLGG